jgi:hypothetical protein
MDLNINICPNDCIVETNKNENVTVEKGNLPFDIFDEENLKNILAGKYIFKNKMSNLYLSDLESGITNGNNYNNSNSNDSTNKYFKNFKPSIIFSYSVSIFRYFINIYNQHGSICLVIYFIIMFWLVFIR